MNRDAIDLGSGDVKTLFFKMLIPTLTSSIFGVLLTITDGIFVGQGLGSDALAAINIVVPLWLLITGIGLMFGMGGSVVASVHMAKNNIKAARIALSQSLFFSSALLIALCITILLTPHFWARILGSSETLEELAVLYLQGFIPFATFNALLCSGPFFVRLDGSPKFAMACGVTSAVLNIILDYLFIFVFKWGIFGAAIATSMGSVVGAAMILYYHFDKRHNLHFYPIKFSTKSIRLMLRNVGYMCKLGSASFMHEFSVGVMMFLGNIAIMKLTGDDGVAAWSIICYIFPIVFMGYNAIGLSAQPIMSFNYGAEQWTRVKESRNIAILIAISSGVIISSFFWNYSGSIAWLFINPETATYQLAKEGLKLFGIGFPFFAFSVTSSVYLQSIERAKKAAIITVIRGIILMAVCFQVLPLFFGMTGAWLSVPLCEIISALLAFWLIKRK